MSFSAQHPVVAVSTSDATAVDCQSSAPHREQKRGAASNTVASVNSK